MKYAILIFTLFLSTTVLAGGWSNTAPINDLEVIRGQGFQIRGDFGNPSQCSMGDTIFVAKNHPQYDQLLSVALSAFMGGKKIMAYSHQCINYGWHGGTYNELDASAAMYIKN